MATDAETTGADPAMDRTTVLDDGIMGLVAETEVQVLHAAEVAAIVDRESMLQRLSWVNKNTRRTSEHGCVLARRHGCLRARRRTLTLLAKHQVLKALTRNLEQLRHHRGAVPLGRMRRNDRRALVRGVTTRHLV